MSANTLKLGAVGVILGALLAALVVLHRNNTRLREHAHTLRQRNQTLAASAAENERGHAVLAGAGVAGSAGAIRDDLTRAQAELRALEEKARKRAGTRPAVEEDFSANRDPEKQPVLLESFSQAGRATPSAAFQTIVWAAMKAQDDALAAAFHLEGVVRERAEALLAGLPADSREKYPTVEKLVALFFTAEFLAKTHTLQITGTTFNGPDQATIALRPNRGAEVKLPMRLAGDGWKFVVTERQIEGITRQLQAQ